MPVLRSWINNAFDEWELPGVYSYTSFQICLSKYKGSLDAFADFIYILLITHRFFYPYEGTRKFEHWP